MGKTKVGNIRTMLTGFDDEKTLWVLISSPKNRMNYEVEAMGVLIGEGRDGEKIPCLCFKVGNQIPYNEEERAEAEECEIEAREQEYFSKPPLGLTPRKIWDRMRAEEIKAAIDRYTKVGALIPLDWAIELHEIEKRSAEE